MRSIRGVLAPMVTPFLRNGDVDLEGVRHNVSRMNATTLSGYFVLGSNGEAAHLTDAEQFEVLRAAKGAADPAKIFVAGISRQSAHATVEFGKKAQAVGVDYLSVLTPSYFAPAMNDARLISYYVAVADRLDTPILLYNCPKFAAGITLSVEAVAELAKHPNILGMKDTSSGPIEKYLECQSGKFSIVSGSINNIMKALDHGSTGGVLSMANFLPDEVERICALHLAGDRDGAAALAERLVELNARVSGKLGVAGVKCACDLLGYRGGFVRSPLTMPEPEAAGAVAAALREFSFL